MSNCWQRGLPGLLAAAAAFGLVLAPMIGCGKGKSGEEQKDVKKDETPQPVPAAKGPDAAALQSQAKAIFQGPLPARADKPGSATTEAQIALGRMLYYDTRLSKNHDISCNSCHSLTDYGIDVRDPEGQRQVSKGHKGQLGDRNSPTVYHAALQTTQFWDGRAADVEEQAKGPVLNPVEMAMADDKAVVATLASIPGYVDAFKAAFPGEAEPLTYDNMAKAIGAFERGLITPSRFDEFLAGKTDALQAKELEGLQRFMEVGCTACHMGPALGGTMFQKLGLIRPYDSKDPGRAKVTGNDVDKYFFKVPVLRNIEKTGPYLHDGSVATLEEAIAMMAEYQTARGKLGADDTAAIAAFLGSLTGELPAAYIAQPELPASGPKTPKPDPS